MDTTPLVSTLKGNEPYSLDYVVHSAKDAMRDSFIVGQTFLEVESVPTYLCVYSIQTNQNVLTCGIISILDGVCADQYDRCFHSVTLVATKTHSA